jgi:hypothetical protein
MDTGAYDGEGEGRGGEGTGREGTGGDGKTGGEGCRRWIAVIHPHH